MLLRDLKMEPREREHYFDKYWVNLRDGSALFIQRAASTKLRYPVGTWFIFHAATYGSHSHYLATRYELDEFEAQAVFDHYLQFHGVTDEAL
ncbi:hypothetical protein CWO91_16815 [Bradyrhizobium genosp. SA-3]|uniref:hypothetical protein n=1 Tax=Bradyrhizobium genosp. SA-3 TaxID=508868 RepID=UPI001029C4A2|nr:hypothetical protein [Bradyrhizobium genosp. SA-3]RZN09690.1 hypothetical protein CWO91_16815 [Bradyrhizobium genosp. SA-3]